MDYNDSKSQIRLGEEVIIDDDTKGVVVCDFDSWKCLSGYEKWLVKEELVGGGYLDNGVLVETKDFGIFHCTNQFTTIKKFNK